MAAGEDPFVGRDAELRRLGALVDGARDGAGGAVLVEGPPGIGKTRLVAEAMARSGLAGDRIRTAGCPADEAVPFGVVATALGLDRRGADAATEGFDSLWRQIDETVDSVERLASEAALVIVVDDVQWSDRATLLALRELSHRAPASSLAVVMTRRPVDRSTVTAFDDEVAPGGAVELLPLGPLSSEEVLDLARTHLGDDLGTVYARHLDEARGNPFFVRELLVGGPRPPDTGAGAPGGPTILAARLGALDLETRLHLRMASVLGRRFSTADLAALIQRPVVEVVRTLAEAERRGVLRVEGDEYAFAHDLLREALYADIAQPSRRAIHADVAALLRDHNVDATRVAPHVLASAEPGDLHAVEWLEEAAATVAMQRPADAADLLQGARDLLGADADRDRRHTIDVRLAELLCTSGRFEESRRVAETALDSAPIRRHEARLRLAAAESRFFLGDPAGAAPEFELAADLATVDADLTRAGAGLAWLQAGRIPDANRCLASVVDSPDAAARSLALGASGFVAGVDGDLHGLSLLEQAVEAAAEDPDRAHRQVPYMFLAMGRTEADREGVDDAIDRGQRLQSVIGTRLGEVGYHGARGVHHLYRGRLDQADAELATAIRLAQDLGQAMLLPIALGSRAHVALLRDDLDASEHLTSEAEAVLGDRGLQTGLELVVLNRAELHREAGDIDAARNQLEALRTGVHAVGARLFLRALAPVLIPLQLDSGDVEDARALVDEVAAVADRGGIPGFLALSHRLRGTVGNDPDAALRAAELARDVPRPLELAATLADAAAVLSGNGRHAEATTLREEAIHHYRACGADLRLRHLGVATEEPDVKIDTLTPTERRVAELVAQGLTNRQAAERLVVSRRTVDNHLYRIFAKLGVSNRVELAVQITGAAPRTGQME